MNNHGYNRIIQNNKEVFEHRVIAEKMLKRKLKRNEIVHHIDGNKKNNSVDNLMVFASQSDHMAYHNGEKAYKNDDGTYSCENVSGRCVGQYNKHKKICPYCHKNKMEAHSKMCRECYLEQNREQRAYMPSKEELLNLILNNSFLQIGKMYNLSDNAIRKWCRKYGLPFKREEIKALRVIHE